MEHDGPLWWSALYAIASSDRYTRTHARMIALLLRLLPCFECRRTVLFVEAVLIKKEMPLSVDEAVDMIWFTRDPVLRLDQLRAFVDIKLGKPARTEPYPAPDWDQVFSLIEEKTVRATCNQVSSELCVQLERVGREGRTLLDRCSAMATHSDQLRRYAAEFRELHDDRSSRRGGGVSGCAR
jgi:hypothetical protein